MTASERARRRASPWSLPAPALALALALGGCPEEQPASADPVILRVGTRSVPWSTVLLQARSKSAPGEFPASGSGFEAFRDRLLKEIAVEEVLLTEAAARGLATDVSSVDAAVAEFRQFDVDPLAVPGLPDPAPPAASAPAPAPAPNPEGSPLAERYGDEAAFRRVVERRRRVEQIEALLRQELAEGVEVTDEQVSSAMPRYASELGTPARIRVRQLFVTDADKARGLQLELSQGADFGELARRTHGGDGDMGWMDASAAPQVMLDATLGLQPGGVTELVHSPLGYHIFQLLERKEATTMPADEARAEVRRRLRDEAVESRLRAWIAARSDALVVDVDEDAAMRIQCCRMGLPYLRSPGEETP